MNAAVSQGITADTEELSSIAYMPAPTDVSGVRRFLGAIDQLAKLMPDLFGFTESSRELLLSKAN